nr:MAG TPA: Pectate lyase [Caudoviricetes sp.]
MDFDKIKERVLNSSETSELHEEFEINNFLPEFEPLKISGKNLAQQYVSAFNTGMNIYQCLNYLQGYVYTLVTAMNETIDAWNTVVPLLEQATKEWTDEEFDYKWSILKPQVIELVTNLTIETFNKSWEELKPQVIKLAQDTTDAEFKKQWDILKPQVIELVQNTTTDKFNSEWEKLKPTIIQLSTDTTIAQFNRSWSELKPQVIELAQTTTNTKFDEKWTELRPQLIELAQTTTSDKFDEKWTELQPTLTETVNNLAKTQTTTTFNEEWAKLKPQVIELAQTTTSDKFDEKWAELQPTLTETVNNLVSTNLEAFKSTLWQEVTKNDSFPFLLPENFGAVGDGQTDDSHAFNACFAKASETVKNVLLSRKSYLINRQLESIADCNVIGLNSQIIVDDNNFIRNTENVNFKNIFFTNITPTNNFITLILNPIKTCFENCEFLNFKTIFGNLNKDGDKIIQLLNKCKLNNTSIYHNSVKPDSFGMYEINNTIINNIDKKIFYNFWSGYCATLNFNSCSFNSSFDGIQASMFEISNKISFNNCNFNIKNKYSMISTLSDNFISSITFNGCVIDTDTACKAIATNSYVSLKIKDSFVFIKTLINSNYESSLWLENNNMDTKPIINSGTGKVNLVEIQQKYDLNSENVFPWISEIPSTYENNVKLIKPNNTEYYVLTENRFTNVKKLDYYFNYSLNYLPNAPYYNNNIIFSSLGLVGYTVKKALLNNELCKLKNDSGELIDYVYMMLDECTVNTEETTLGEETTIAMKFLPYFAKLKTDTAVGGQCDVNMCISIILEKTS